MQIVILIVVLVLIVLYFKWDAVRQKAVPFQPEWRLILQEKVAFYNALNDTEKQRFEKLLCEFFARTRVTGIDVSIDDTDKVLVASSAVIPVFAFPNWQYAGITEVLIYPNSFNEQFETAGEKRQILGMVGTGAMHGTMILSKQALRQGFENHSDKQNTAIHEFVHLIDKLDGAVDGVPEALLDKQYVLPWVNLMAGEIKKIHAGKSDINPYGATGNTEFFAVVSEYFFEQPELLRKKHPELYEMLERIFSQKMSLKKLILGKHKISRNDPCPCNKGAKFKNCCGASHFAK